MKELNKQIREIVEEYFDKKLRKSSYYSEQEIWDMIDEAVCEMQDLAYEYDQKVDNYIDECEADYLPTRTDMMNAYDNFRQSELGG